MNRGRSSAERVLTITVLMEQREALHPTALISSHLLGHFLLVSNNHHR